MRKIMNNLDREPGELSASDVLKILSPDNGDSNGVGEAMAELIAVVGDWDEQIRKLGLKSGSKKNDQFDD